MHLAESEYKLDKHTFADSDVPVQLWLVVNSKELQI